MPSQRATPAAADRSAVARDEVRPPQRGQRRGYPGTIADLLRRVVRRNPLVEPPQRPLDIHSWHSSRTQSDIAFLDCRCHQADLQKRQSPDRGPRGPHLERTTTLTDLARMTWDQLRAHITDLTEETGALIKADGDTHRRRWLDLRRHRPACGLDRIRRTQPALRMRLRRPRRNPAAPVQPRLQRDVRADLGYGPAPYRSESHLLGAPRCGSSYGTQQVRRRSSARGREPDDQG